MTSVNIPLTGMNAGIHANLKFAGFRYFLLYRKDRLRRSLELKKARTEAGTTSRR